jgi:AraC family transcriptional regulator
MNQRPHQYDSFMDFYRDTYETSISRTHTSALSDVSLIDLDQGAGDWSDQAHPELVIAQIKSPELKLTASFGNGTYRGHFRGAHGMIIQPPDAHVSIHIDNPHRFHVLAIPYQKLLTLVGQDVLPTDGDFGRLSGAPFADRELFNLVGNLRAEAEAGNPRGVLYAQGGLMMLAATLAGLGKNPMAAASRGGLAPWQVQRAIEMMAASEGSDISLTAMANAVGLSAYHFCRAFKQSTGIPPHRYQIMLRIVRAKDLLANSAMSISDVAAAVGYDDQGQLARLFRREIGTTPSHYRRERRA